MVNDLLYKEILERMEEYKNKINYNTIGTEILLLTLMNIEDSMTYLILKELNVTEQKLLNIINDFIFIRDQTKYTNTLKDVFKKAKEFQEKKEYVYDEPYLYALLEEPNNVAMDILKKLEIKNFQIKDELENALSYLEEDDKMLSNLTKKAKNNELNKFIGRSYYINEIDLVLSKKQKNNCMLIGPAGVGKSGAVEGLAYKYLKNKPNITIYELDLGNLIAGTRYRGDLEEKLMDTLDSIKGDNNILFIDEIHNIVGAGGAGFPTLPVAILRPDVKILAVDSTAKRIAYVKGAAELLGLENVEAVTMRAEDGGKDPLYREKFDVVTARAVAEMRILSELCLPYVRVGGQFMAMKGKNAEFELQGAKRAISMLGGRDVKVEEITLHGFGEELTHPLIVIAKKERSPQNYPRPYAQISKKPL